MKILLTGATGFIGAFLSKELLTHQHQVVALTRRAKANEIKDEALGWIYADLSQPNLVLPDVGKIEAVIHLAQSRKYRAFPEEAHDIFNVNVNSVFKLLNYARQAGVKVFIYASSANVYPPGRKPILENNQTAPTSFYGQTKRMAELLVESYSGFFQCVVLRLFTVYGPGQVKMLIPDLINRVRKREAIQVQGRLGLRLSPIYVTDVCRVIRLALEETYVRDGNEFCVFNVGGDETMSIYEMGQIIGQALNISPQFEFTEQDEPAGWIANNAKIKSTFACAPLTTFEEGIRYMVDDFAQLSFQL